MAKDLAEWLDEFVVKGADPNNVPEWPEEVGKIEVVDKLPEVGKPDIFYKLPDGTIWSCVNTTETVSNLEVGKNFKLIDNITIEHFNQFKTIMSEETVLRFTNNTQDTSNLLEFGLDDEGIYGWFYYVDNENNDKFYDEENVVEGIIVAEKTGEVNDNVEITQIFLNNIEAANVDLLLISSLFENGTAEQEVSTWTNISTVQADWNQTDETKPDFIKNKPTIPTAQVQSDWNQSDTEAVDFIKNKPNIPNAQVQSDWNETNTNSKAYIQNKPTIPDAQIQADWNQSNNNAKDFIKNKPTIPTVNNSTITLTQGGITKGSFTLNQSSGATINLDAGGGSSIDIAEGTGIDITTESDGTKVISVDTTTVAMKTDIPTVNYPVTDVQVNGNSVLNNTVAEITIPAQLSGGTGIDVSNNTINSVGVGYLTTAPASANTGGDLKIVVLSSEPSTKYSGYLYIITN